jgi:hypothetical protein
VAENPKAYNSILVDVPSCRPKADYAIADGHDLKLSASATGRTGFEVGSAGPG